MKFLRCGKFHTASRRALFTLLFSLSSTACWAVNFYVKSGGTGDGTSWASPLGDVQAAINACAASGGGEVQIAGGTYLPTNQPNISPATSDPRDNHFSLKDGVSVRGGFAPQGAATPAPQRYPTILTGDRHRHSYSRPQQ